MKKILLASTALAFSAGMASAQVTIGGYGFMGVTSTGGVTTVAHGARLTFTGTVQADHDLTFSMFSRQSIAPGGVVTGDRMWVRAAGHGLTLTVGNTNGAVRSLARTAYYYGFNDGGIFGAEANPAALFQADAGQNIYAQYAFDGLTVGASTTIAAPNQIEIAARYSMSGFTVAAGINASTSAYAIHLGYNGGDWAVGAGYNSANTLVVGGSYTFNDVTIGAAIQSTGGATNYGLNVGYNLGGGATLSGTVGSTGGVTTLGAGVFFSF